MGNSIPPSPGDESSVFWRENHQAANVLFTTVDITQSSSQKGSQGLFTLSATQSERVFLLQHPQHTIKGFKLITL